MTSRLLELAKTPSFKNGISKRLLQVLDADDSPYGKSKEALKILDEIPDKKSIDFGITTIANQIFIKDSNLIHRELYKDFLKKMELDVSYFEIPRLLNDGQYEQAALLSLHEFDRLSKLEYLDEDRSASNLQMFKILIEATTRNDTVIISQLLDRLNNLKILTDSNYSHILAAAMSNKNDILLTKLYDNIKVNNIILTDATWECYADVFIQSGNSENVIEIIQKVKLIDVKNSICLKWISSFDFKECMLLLDSLTTDKTLKTIEFNNLPPPLLSIPDLDQYSNIEEKLVVLNDMSLVHIKQILIYSLLSSIDNTNIHMGSTIFLMNGLGFNKDLLNDHHKDIIFHQLSKYSFKLTSLKFLKLFKKLELKITVTNYIHLIRCHCNGEEHDTLFYLLIEILNDHGKIPPEISKILSNLEKVVRDHRLKLFTRNISSLDSISDLKYKINYEFLEKNLEYEPQRTKTDHEIIKSYVSYDYHKDLKLLDSLIL